MPNIFKETFHLGLVTARDPTLLRPGEVAQADDCVYRPNDPAIHRAPARTAFGVPYSLTLAFDTTAGQPTIVSNTLGIQVISLTTTVGSTTVTVGSSYFVAAHVGLAVYCANLPANSKIASVVNDTTATVTFAANTSGAANAVVTGIWLGDFVYGGSLPAQTYVTAGSAGASTLTLTLSNNAGSTATAASLVFAPRINGLAFLPYDGATVDKLLVMQADMYAAADFTALTGSFVAYARGLTTGNIARTLETVKAGPTHHLLNGIDRNRVAYWGSSIASASSTSFTIRPSGMDPITSFVASQVVRVAGQWSSILGNATYFFLVTEVYHPGESDECEGGFTGTPQSVTITDFNTQSVSVSKNADGSTTLVNDGNKGRNTATHWRIYMSPGQSGTSPVPALYTFRQVATVDVAQASFVLSDANPKAGPASPSTTAQYSTVRVFNNAAGFTGTAKFDVASVTTTSGSAVITSAAAFGSVKTGMQVFGTGIPGDTFVIIKTSTSSLTLSRNATANGTVTLTFGTGENIDANVATDGDGSYQVANKLQNFGFVNSAAYSATVIRGIQIDIGGRLTNANGGGDRGFSVWVRRTGAVSGSDVSSATRLVKFPTSGTLSPSGPFAVVSLGGVGDNWGITWNAGLADFVDTNFEVIIVKNGAAIAQQHYIDYVKVTVFTGSTSVNLDGNAFPTVTITTQVGEGLSYSANMPGPVASTGDIYEGQMVTNDVANPTEIVYSLPGQYEYYPTPYRVKFPIVDEIVTIRRVGNALLAFALSAVKRIAYLPREQDAEFNTQKIWEDVSVDLGCASTKGVAVFTMPGRGPLAGFISYVGPMLTDGITTWPMNMDLDWANTVELTKLDQCVLVNYPSQYALVLFYTPTGGSFNTKALWFCYHPSHLKDGGQLAAVGPINVKTWSAAVALLGGVPYLLTGHLQTGTVYVEDNGNTGAADGTVASPIIRSRQIYAADVGRQSRIERAWLRVDGAGDATTGVCNLAVYRQNIGEDITLAETKTFTTDASTQTGPRLVVVHTDNFGESFQLQVSKALDQHLRLHYVSLLGEGGGLEKNRA